MPETITLAYVAQRFEHFVQKYKAALEALGYSEVNVTRNCAQLTHRLETHDFKLYGAAPVNYLHGGKRITRFLLKSAIEHRPAETARRDRLHAEYSARLAEIRVNQPFATCFSFEAAYASKLKVRLAPFKKLFFL